MNVSIDNSFLFEFNFLTNSMWSLVLNDERNSFDSIEGCGLFGGVAFCSLSYQAFHYCYFLWVYTNYVGVQDSLNFSDLSTFCFCRHESDSAVMFAPVVCLCTDVHSQKIKKAFFTGPVLK